MPENKVAETPAEEKTEQLSPKERLKEITDKIEDGIKQLFDTDRYRQYLKTMSQFHRYSLNNTMLIYMQKPDATMVAGFDKWKDKFQRHVGKGEKGIKIIAPVPHTVKKSREKLDPDTKAPIMDKDGNPVMEEVEVKIPQFRVVSVFDVSQTYGKPLPTLAKDLQGDVPRFEAFMDQKHEEEQEAPAVVPVASTENFHITDDHLGEGGQKTKYANNIAAIRTLKTIEAENRHATKEEQEILSRYVGWGGIPQAFDDSNSSWTDEYRELKSLLTEDEYEIQSDTHRFYCTIGEAETIKELGIRCRREEIVLAKSFPALSGILDTVKSAFQNYTDYLWNDKLFHVADVLYKRIGNKAKFMYSYEKYKKYVRNHLKKNPPTKPEDGIGDIYQAFYDSLMIDYEDYDATESLRLNIDTAVKIQRMFRKYKELIDNNIEIEGYSYEKGISAKVKSYSVLDYIDNIVHSDDFPYEIMKGTLNALDFGAPQKRERFIIIGSRIGDKPDFPDGQFGQTLPIRTVKDAIADLEDEKPSKEPIENGVLRKKPYIHENQPLHELRDSDILFNHFNTVTGEIAQKRFDELKEGGNFHTLPDTLKETYSDGKRTQSTIYLKLKYSEPCGTVVNVRKSMWVHPTKNRSLSVREAARLQTFPDHFRFFGTKDSQFQQVGNAVPPILAKAIAEKVVDYLEANGKQETRERILLEIMLDNSFTEMEIAKRLNVSQATVSHHLIRFEAEGIVKRTQEGKRHVWHYVPKADRNNSVDITIPAV